jgi:hypothetical protein
MSEKCELVCVCAICGHENMFDITEKEIVKANAALRAKLDAAREALEAIADVSNYEDGAWIGTEDNSAEAYARRALAEIGDNP